MPTLPVTTPSPPPGAGAPVDDPDGDPTGSLFVVPWVDAVIDRVGHDPRSAYVETFWLGVLGPSTTWLVRRLAAGFDGHPEGYPLDAQRTARALGIGHRAGSTSPFIRSLARAERFGLARIDAPRLEVRRRIPPLTRRLVDRLPPDLRDEHQRWLEQARRDGHGPPTDDERQRVRAVARSMLQLGEAPAEVELALHRRRVHPALAADAVRWALSGEEP